jgi:hypothetical protein
VCAKFSYYERENVEKRKEIKKEKRVEYYEMQIDSFKVSL